MLLPPPPSRYAEQLELLRRQKEEIAGLRSALTAAEQRIKEIEGEREREREMMRAQVQELEVAVEERESFAETAMERMVRAKGYAN